MAYNDFTFPRVVQELGLRLVEGALYSDVAAIPLREDFAATLAEGAKLALALNTEKAKSEFIIAPVLLEARRQLGRTFGLFSGVEMNVDSSKGLNGICDFILSGSPLQFVLTAPLLTVVEAKNDNIRNGLGQCIASMFASDLFNQRNANPIAVVYRIVTTGEIWKFLRLEGTRLTIDDEGYYITDPGKILGVLLSFLRPAIAKLSSAGGRSDHRVLGFLNRPGCQPAWPDAQPSARPVGPTGLGRNSPGLIRTILVPKSLNEQQEGTL